MITLNGGRNLRGLELRPATVESYQITKLMALFIASLAAGIVWMTALVTWKRQSGDLKTMPEGRIFRRWSIAGVVVPCAVWIVLNTGLLGAPVWPLVAPWSAGAGIWWRSVVDPLAAGIFLISSYWCGVTSAWLVWRGYERAEDRRAFRLICGSWSLILVPGMALVLVLGGWGALGLALMLAGFPLFHATRRLFEVELLPPSYARALARINFGNYAEAELEVIRELERCETDFDGWMMLAELYATHFEDLEGADRTLRDICDEPTTTLVQFAIAMHKLAGWHLKLGHDPIAARQILERICERAPGTHLEKMARQRMEQLPATREELMARERGKPLRLPKLPDLAPPSGPGVSREQATLAANECVEALKSDPDDTISRVKFARLLAESLGRTDQAIEQLELLLAMRDQGKEKRAEWLCILAGWHARLREDKDKARLLYQEVISDFPDTAHAFEAQRRLNLLRLESRLPSRPLKRATV